MLKKKLIRSFSILLCVFVINFIFLLKANAVEVTCKYEKLNNSVDATIKLTNGKVNVTTSACAVVETPIKPSDFQSGSAYACPKTLYYSLAASSRGCGISASFVSGSYDKMAPLTNESITGIDSGSNPDPYKICEYEGAISVSYNSKEIVLSTPRDQSALIKADNLKLSDVATGCPVGIKSEYTSYGNSYTFTFTDTPGTNDHKLVKGTAKPTSSNGIKQGTVIDPITGEPINCSDFIYQDENNTTQNIINEIFNIFMIAAPILLIIFGSIDFAKATLASDEQAIKKAGVNFGKRAIAAILLFLVPLIISLVLNVAFDAGVFDDKVPEICLDK